MILRRLSSTFQDWVRMCRILQSRKKVYSILSQHQLSQFDFIQSDIAPNTIGLKDIDAMRSIDLLEQTYWMYDELLRDDGTFVIKIFMWPGFDEFVAKIKKRFWAKTIKLFKPQSCRANSKETYIVRVFPQK